MSQRSAWLLRVIPKSRSKHGHGRNRLHVSSAQRLALESEHARSLGRVGMTLGLGRPSASRERVVGGHADSKGRVRKSVARLLDCHAWMLASVVLGMLAVSCRGCAQGEEIVAGEREVSVRPLPTASAEAGEPEQRLVYRDAYEQAKKEINADNAKDELAKLASEIDADREFMP